MAADPDDTSLSGAPSAPGLDALVAALRSADAEHWSLYATAERRFRLGVKDREVANPHSPVRVIESGSVFYRVVWAGGAMSRGQLQRHQVQTDPHGAAAQARLAAHDDPDAAWIPEPAPTPDVRLHDDGAAALASGDVDRVVRRLDSLRGRAAGGKFRTWSSSFGAARAAIALRSSTGLDVNYLATSVGWHLTLDGEIGGGFSARAEEPDEVFEARVEEIAQTALRLREPARSLTAGVRPVLLHPKVVESWVIQHLLSNLGGSAVANGEGRFRREDFGSGRPVLREDLGLAVDPLLPLRAGSYRFTPEGVPACRGTYVENGCLISPILGLKYARRLGSEPTAMPYAADALVLSGPAPVDAEDASADAAVLVRSVLGVHTQDAASGDFSLSAPQCLRTGEADGGRLRLTLSGNLFDVLRDASLRFVRFPRETTPGLLVRCHVDPR